MKIFSFVFLIFHVGVYGDVQRVKILYNKKDSALVQLAEPHQAHLGMDRSVHKLLTNFLNNPNKKN